MDRVNASFFLTHADMDAWATTRIGTSAWMSRTVDQPRLDAGTLRKNALMIPRSASMDSAALMAVRKCEPFSRPFVYQDPSARSLLITQRSCPTAGRSSFAPIDAGADVPEPTRLVHSFRAEQFDVFEQEPASVLQCDVAGSCARPPDRRPGQGSRVAQNASANEHAVTPLRNRPRRSPGSMQSPLPKTGMLQLTGNPRNEIPVRPTRVALRGRPTVNGHRRGAGILHHLRQRAARFVSSSFHPARILTVTGILTAFVIAAIDRRRVGRFAHQAATGLCFAIFGTGQPMLTSTMSAPMPSTICAAAAIFVGIAAEDLNGDRPFFLRVLGVLERPVDPAHESFRAHHLGHDETAAAWRLTSRRNAESVMPAIGATAKGEEVDRVTDLHRDVDV